MAKTIAIVIVVILFASQAQAATLYRDTVACTGNYSITNRTCTGSDGNSYTTNATAIAAMSAGDTILVRSGTYDDRVSFVSRTGSPSTVRTFKAYPGETVTFRSTTTSSYGLLVSSSSYVTIENIIIDGVLSISTLSNRIEGSSTSNITINNVTFKNWIDGNGLYITAASNVTISGGAFQDNGDYTSCTTGKLQYGVYVHDGTNITIEKTVISGNANGGAHFYPGPITDLTFRKNDVHGNSRCSAVTIGGVIAASDSTGGNMSGVRIYSNVIYGNPAVTTQGNGGGIRIYATGGRSVTGTEIYRNTIYNHQANSGTAYGINIQAGASGTLIKNNHVIGNQSGQIADAGTGTVSSGNRATGALTDCTVSTTNFTQKSGSSCIDAGVDDGLPANGSPDVGAFETVVFSSCSVESGATSSIVVNYVNNVAPPLLPSTGVTTFTARKNAVANALTGTVVRSGDSAFILPVTNPYAGGDPIDISISTNNITDSSLIGGTINQPLVQSLTNQSCTNNVAGVSYTLTQAKFELHYPLGSETAPVILPDGISNGEDYQNYPIRKSGKIRMRMALVCGGANCPDTAFNLRYSTGGGYSNVPDAFDSGNIRFCGDQGGDEPDNGAVTTNQLSTAGTFVPGGIIYTSNAIPTIVGLNNGYKTEMEYCVQFDTDATGNYDFRMYTQSGVALNTYTITPRLVVTEGSSGGQ